MSNLTDNLNRLMKANGLNKTTLAKASGVPKSTIYMIFNRDQSSLRVKAALPIAKTLGVTLNDLFAETEEEMIVNEIAPPTIDKTTFVNGLSEALKWDPQSKVMDIKYFERFGGHPFEVVKINFVDGTDKKIQVTGYNCGTIYKEVGAAVYGPGALRELTDEDIKSMK